MGCPIGLDRVHCQNCYFIEGGVCNYEKMTAPETTTQWMRSDCPICGQSFPHKIGYTPVTCGRFDCLQEAKRRGLLQGVK